MSIQGVRSLSTRAVVYIVDTVTLGVPERAALTVMNRVAQEGVPTFLIAPVSTEEASGMLLRCNEIFSIPELGRPSNRFVAGYHRLVGFLKICRVLYDLSQEYTDLVVHTHGTVAGFWGRWAAWSCGIGHTIHTVYQFGFGPYMQAYQWWLAYVTEYITSWVTSEYVCLTTKDRSLGIRLLPFFAKRCAVIRSSVDWQQFYTPEPSGSVMRLPANPVVIGIVLEAGSTQEQSLYTFLHLIEKLHQMGVPIKGEVIGDGSWRWKSTQWFLERGLHGMVSILGWQAQTAAVIKTWHIFVHCSVAEQPSVAVVQARLSWVPVVAYATGGVDEVIKNEKSGLLVAVDDEKSLFNAVYRVIIDRPLYEKLATHHDSLVDYSEAAVCGRYIKLYRNNLSE